MAAAKEENEEVKKGWTVTIEGRAAKALDPEDVLEHLAKLSPAVSYRDGMLSTTVTIDANSYAQACDYIYEALSEAVQGELDIDRVEAMTEERQEEELAKPTFPPMVGIVEIADMIGSTRQRAFQITANRSFPTAIIETRSGRLWLKAAVERYVEGRRVGRPSRMIDTTRTMDVTPQLA